MAFVRIFANGWPKDRVGVQGILQDLSGNSDVSDPTNLLREYHVQRYTKLLCTVHMGEGRRICDDSVGNKRLGV